MSNAPEDRQRKLQEAKAQLGKDRMRLGILGTVLAVVLTLYFAVGNQDKEADSLNTNSGPALPLSATSLPPVDQEALAEVSDAEENARILLEPGPFRSLARVAQTLQPGHLRALDEPEFPFEDPSLNPQTLRGKPFRFRGSMQHARTVRRSPGAPEEFWCLLEDEDGHQIHLVSLAIPSELFGAENFVRADGFFFKMHTRTVEDRKVTAPLLVGREVAPSFRATLEVDALDRFLLASVRDHQMGESDDVDDRGLWHLLGYAEYLKSQPEKYQNIFGQAPEMDFDLLRKLAAEPGLYRGQPMRIPGRVPDSSRFRWSDAAGENPLRASWLHWGFLGNLAFNDHITILIGTGDQDFSGNKARWYEGFFLQLKGYTDQTGNPRRTPVFVIAGFEEADRTPPPMIGKILTWFLAGALAIGVFLIVVIMRDRKSALAASQARLARRRKHD